MKPILAVLVAVMIFAALVPAPALAQTCTTTYTVQAGDTLYSIAQKCRVSYLVLMGINYEISDPARIYPGQVIRLEAEVPLVALHPPATGPAQDAGYQPGGAYVVRKGDSLARIAYLYGTTVSELLRLNPQLNGSAIIITGQVLLMPVDAIHKKGWVGVSTLLAVPREKIEARAVDFTPYARLQFRLGMRDETDKFDYQIVTVRSDARGEARATLTIPYYAWENELWEVRVVNMDEGEDTKVISPAIRIID